MSKHRACSLIFQGIRRPRHSSWAFVWVMAVCGHCYLEAGRLCCLGYMRQCGSRKEGALLVGDAVPCGRKPGLW